MLCCLFLPMLFFASIATVLDRFTSFAGLEQSRLAAGSTLPRDPLIAPDTELSLGNFMCMVESACPRI